MKEREQGEGEIEGKESREEGMEAGDEKSEEGGYEQLRKGLKGRWLNKEERKRRQQVRNWIERLTEMRQKRKR